MTVDLIRYARFVRKANLKLNREKCQLGQTQLKFIGDIITSEGIKPDPDKVAAIINMQRPQCTKDLQRLLGMVNYLAKFIPDLSETTAPLRILLDKKVEWIWSPVQEKAWKGLKELLSTPPLLKFYDPDKAVRISSDASSTGLGAVLLQMHDQAWQPVAYASRAMTEAETKKAFGNYLCLRAVSPICLWAESQRRDRPQTVDSNLCQSSK